MTDITRTSWPTASTLFEARFPHSPSGVPMSGRRMPPLDDARSADDRGSFLSDLLFLVRFAFGMPSAYGDIGRD